MERRQAGASTDLRGVDEYSREAATEHKLGSWQTESIRENITAAKSTAPRGLCSVKLFANAGCS